MKIFTYNFYNKIILGIILFSSIGFSQIPNAGFESWTNGNPDNWSTTNNPQFTTITQTNDSHSGSYAAKGTVASFSTITVSPILLDKFAYNGRPSSLTGYYKFTSSNSDTLVIVAATYKGNVGISGGVFHTSTSVSSYTQFTASLIYDATDNPDSAAISISIDPVANPHSGSEFYIDDLSFSNATAVNNKIKIPFAFSLKQNYPNPFNPSTMIEYQIPRRSYVVLSIYNILGSKIVDLVNEEESSGIYSIQYNASNLPSGIYYYVIQAGSFHQAKKMMLLK